MKHPHRHELNTMRMRNLRKEVRSGDHGPCVPCGSADDLTIGHIIPRILGGTLDDGWQVECRSCNSADGARLRWAR